MNWKKKLETIEVGDLISFQLSSGNKRYAVITTIQSGEYWGNFFPTIEGAKADIRKNSYIENSYIEAPPISNRVTIEIKGYKK